MIYKGRIVWNAKFNVLAEYNRDRQRGYVFPPETVERMAKLQREYNEEYMNTETEDRRSTQTPVIDRGDEFDQTRQHAHIPASLCPVLDCKEWPTVATARNVNGYLARGPHVSPAINEFRIFELETQLKARSYLLDIEREKNAVLLQRIAGFERMNERLSNAVDEWLTNATSEHKAAA